MTIPSLAIPSYAAPTTIDWSPLSALGDTIEKNRNRQTLADLGKGLADGTIDYRQAAGKLASTGSNLNGVMSLLQLGEAKDKLARETAASNAFTQSLGGMFGGQPSTTPAAASIPASNYGAAISSIESGGKYDALGPVTKSGDRAYGKYQVLGANIGPWTQEVLGRSMTPQEFVANPQLQDAVFNAKFGDYAKRFGPEGAARAWFAGEKGMNDPNRRDQLGTSVSAYGQRFTSALNGQGDSAIPANARPTQGTVPQAQPQQGVGMAQVPALLGAMANPNLPTAQKEIAKTLLTRALDESKTPDKIKTLQQIKQQSGYPGTILDLEKELRSAGKTEINLDQRAETAEAKSAGEAAGKRRADMFAAAGAAPKTLVNLSRTEALLNQVSQGKLQPSRMSISAWAKALGLNDDVASRIGLDPKGVGSAQALQSLINESVVGKIGAGGFPANNFSDADREFITKIFVSLGDEPAANKIKVEAARRMAQLDIDRAKAFQAFKRDPANKGRGFEDFELQWADDIAKKDVFGDLRKQAESIVDQPRNDIGGTLNNPGAAPAQQPRGASGSWGDQSPAQVSSPDDARRLPPGTRFITPDGREFVR